MAYKLGWVKFGKKQEVAPDVSLWFIIHMFGIFDFFVSGAEGESWKKAEILSKTSLDAIPVRVFMGTTTTFSA